uniref:Uncharacterized protein n=1 Tax=Solanum tuberosum TaxID=4113 RepID=M0ZQI2_SOLTU
MDLPLDAVALELCQEYLPVYESYRGGESYHSSWMIINLVAITQKDVYSVRLHVEVFNNP